ncbi:MAG: hypothetical protein Kow0092_27100 [Deferrisomatales bacterium]
MRTPLELTFRDVDGTPALEEYIRRSVRKLEDVCAAIVSCRIAVERRHRHQRSGSPYRVRIDLRVPPKHELVITRESGEGEIHDDLRKVLGNAFDSARRQLKELNHRLQGDVKTHQPPKGEAVVVRIFPEEDYGFLRTRDGAEIYFHRNAVLDGAFDRLDVGSGVRFVEVQGDEGPQASTVEVLGKPAPVPEGAAAPGEFGEP